MLRILRNKNYLLLLSGKAVSAFGDLINDIVFMWYILSITNSYITAAFSFVINFIPSIIFSSFAGYLADKKNNKHIIVACDFCNGVLAFLLLISIYMKAPIAALFVISFFMSTLDVFFSISSSTLIPKIVDKDDLLKANSLSSTVTKTIGIIAPILGGFLYTIFSVSLIFLINAVSFIVSACFECFIKVEYSKNIGLNKPNKNTVKNIFIGFKKVNDYRFIKFACITGGSILNFILAPLALYMPVYIKDILRISPIYYGTLITAIPIGGILCSVSFFASKRKVNKYLMVCIGFCLEGFGLTLFALSKSLVMAYVSMLVFGVAISLTGINLSTIIQEEIPRDIFGRINGTISFILGITVPLGYLTGGYLLNKISLSTILMVSSIVIILCGLYSLHYFIKYYKSGSITKNELKNSL